MFRQDLIDFEIGYDYVRRRYSFLENQSYQYLWELGKAYLQTRESNAALSRGMGFYFLELGIKKLLAEIPSAPEKEDCF